MRHLLTTTALRQQAIASPGLHRSLCLGENALSVCSSESARSQRGLRNQQRARLMAAPATILRTRADTEKRGYSRQKISRRVRSLFSLTTGRRVYCGETDTPGTDIGVPSIPIEVVSMCSPRRDAPKTGAEWLKGGGVWPLPRVTLFGLWHDPQVRFRRSPALGKLFLGLVIGDGGDNNNIFALLPVHRGSYLVLRGQLH